MSDILCHIVGIDNILVDDFIDIIGNKYNNTVVLNLDNVSFRLNNTEKMIKLKQKINNIETKWEYDTAWKTGMEKEIDKTIQKYKHKKIILIGSSYHHKNPKLKIHVDTYHRFIYSLPIKNTLKNTVEYNMDKYRKYLIDGKFPLKYLNHTFLESKYEKIIHQYSSDDYVPKTPKVINKWLQHKLHGGIDNHLVGGSKNLYFASHNFFDDAITTDVREVMKNKKLARRNRNKKYNANQTTVYKHDWLALLSSVPHINKYVRKGYAEYKGEIYPFLEERQVGGFNHLHRSCYLYQVDNKNFDCGRYKYKACTNDKVDILNAETVDDIYTHLDKLGVRLVQKK